MCSTLVFSHRFEPFEMLELHHDGGEQRPQMIALPCVANCRNLQVARYHETLFDAKGTLEWLLGTHAAAAGVKHLFIGEVGDSNWQVFLSAFIVAIEQVSIASIVLTVRLELDAQYDSSPALVSTLYIWAGQANRSHPKT